MWSMRDITCSMWSMCVTLPAVCDLCAGTDRPAVCGLCVTPAVCVLCVTCSMWSVRGLTGLCMWSMCVTLPAVCGLCAGTDRPAVCGLCVTYLQYVVYV